MFTLLNLIHGGYVHRKPEIVSLLKQNRYLLIPTVNVDAVNYIEETYEKTGYLENKRKNNHYYDAELALAKTESGLGGKCHTPLKGSMKRLGVDLNRNYDINWK
jgi:hypothetical protein